MTSIDYFSLEDCIELNKPSRFEKLSSMKNFLVLASKRVRIRTAHTSYSLKTTGKFSDGTRPRGRTLTSRPKSCEIRFEEQDSFDGTFDSGIHGASSPNDESDSSINTKTRNLKREFVKLKGRSVEGQNDLELAFVLYMNVRYT